MCACVCVYVPLKETLSNSELYTIPLGKPSGGLVAGLLQVQFQTSNFWKTPYLMPIMNVIVLRVVAGTLRQGLTSASWRVSLLFHAVGFLFFFNCWICSFASVTDPLPPPPATLTPHFTDSCRSELDGQKSRRSGGEFIYCWVTFIDPRGHEELGFLGFWHYENGESLQAKVGIWHVWGGVSVDR